METFFIDDEGIAASEIEIVARQFRHGIGAMIRTEIQTTNVAVLKPTTTKACCLS